MARLTKAGKPDRRFGCKHPDGRGPKLRHSLPVPGGTLQLAHSTRSKLVEIGVVGLPPMLREAIGALETGATGIPIREVIRIALINLKLTMENR